MRTTSPSSSAAACKTTGAQRKRTILNAKTPLPLPKLDALPLGAHRLLRYEDGTNNTSSCRAEAVSEGADNGRTKAGNGASIMAVGESHDGALPVLTDEALFEACGVRIAFTGREGGVSEGPYAKLNCASHVEDDEQAVLRNRQIVLDALGVPNARLIVPNQVHGTNVVCVGGPDDRATATGSTAASSANPSATYQAHGTNAVCEGGSAGTVNTDGFMAPNQVLGADDAHIGDSTGTANAAGQSVADPATSAAADLIVPVAGKVLSVSDALEEAAEGADAIVVKVPEVAALLNYADCLSLIIVAPSGSFAVVHAGWRGAAAHIASKAALELAEQTGEDPSQLNAYIGPHIRSECFEVSAEVAEQFAAEFGASVVVGKRHVSLARAVACDLESAGMSPQRIADCGICTKCNPDRYFSYRATNGRCGRHSAAAVRRVC